MPILLLGRTSPMTDAQAEDSLDAAVRSHATQCPRCGQRRHYRLGSDRLRCSECLLTFQGWTGRWLSRHRLPAARWLAALRAFEYDLDGRKAAAMAGISEPTAFHLTNTVRLSLAALDEAWVGPVQSALREEWDDVPRAFHLHAEEGLLRVEVPALGEQPDLLRLDGLGFLQAQARRESSPVRRQALRSLHVFLKSHRGISARLFPFYLKEWEFRYNRPRKSLFDELLDAVVRYMP